MYYPKFTMVNPALVTFLSDYVYNQKFHPLKENRKVDLLQNEKGYECKTSDKLTNRFYMYQKFFFFSNQTKSLTCLIYFMESKIFSPK